MYQIKMKTLRYCFLLLFLGIAADVSAGLSVRAYRATSGGDGPLEDVEVCTRIIGRASMSGVHRSELGTSKRTNAEGRTSFILPKTSFSGTIRVTLVRNGYCPKACEQEMDWDRKKGRSQPQFNCYMGLHQISANHCPSNISKQSWDNPIVGVKRKTHFWGKGLNCDPPPAPDKNMRKPQRLRQNISVPNTPKINPGGVDPIIKPSNR